MRLVVLMVVTCVAFAATAQVSVEEAQSKLRARATTRPVIRPTTRPATRPATKPAGPASTQAATRPTLWTPEKIAALIPKEFGPIGEEWSSSKIDFADKALKERIVGQHITIRVTLDHDQGKWSSWILAPSAVRVGSDRIKFGGRATFDTNTADLLKLKPGSTVTLDCLIESAGCTQQVTHDPGPFHSLYVQLSHCQIKK